jgi:DNA gyrase inhibitor GyrI
MNLTSTPEIIRWPETHYVYLEKVGPFQETAPAAWNQLHELVPDIADHNKITGYLSLYKVGPKVYRAGLSLAAPPQHIPDGMAYSKFKGGQYSKFVLHGPFSDLPEACGIVFGMVEAGKLQMRDDFCLEHYVTDPQETPENENIIEILIPTV